MEDMNEAYDAYANENLAGMPIEHKKEVARLGYRLAMERQIMQETDAVYESQKETVRNDDARSEEQKTKEIARIEREQTKARDLGNQTIQNYQQGIEQVRVDALAYLEGLAQEASNKRQDKINEKARQEATEEVSEQDLTQEQQDSAQQLTPKQREKRLKDVDKEIQSLEQQYEKESAAIKEEMGVSNPTAAILVNLQGRIDSLKSEKKLLQDQDTVQKKKKTSAKKTAKNTKQGREKREQTKPPPIEGDVGTIATIRRNMGERYYGAEAVIRERLRKKGIPLVVYNNFAKTKNGLRHLGLSEGMSVYLDANRATQETFYHELAHVYMYQFWDSAPVKALRKIVLTQPVMATIKNLYFMQAVFSNGQTTEQLSMTVEDIKTFAAWKEENPNKQGTDYLEYVTEEAKKKNIDILPDSQQNEWVEEAVVMVMSRAANNQDLTGLINPKSKRRWRNNKYWMVRVSLSLEEIKILLLKK
jgi:hypothetical protein